MNVINDFGFRQDGRKPRQIRNISYKLDIYSQADGSAYIEHGNTKVLCAVYGPHECRKRSMINEEQCVVNCQYSMATFSVPDRRNKPRGDRRGNEFTRLLERAFESAILVKNYPRSQIDIFCEVLEADGGNLAACVNAASLALADAGIPMRGLVTAVECGSVTGEACADLSSREHSDIVSRLTVATVGGKDEICMLDLKNIIHKDHVPQLIKMAMDANAQIHSCLESAVLIHMKKCYALSKRC